MKKTTIFLSVFLFFILFSISPLYLKGHIQNKSHIQNDKLLIHKSLSPIMVKQESSDDLPQFLQLSDRKLFISNDPEFVHTQGVLSRVTKIGAKNGKLRIFFSHLNLLHDKNNPNVNVSSTMGFILTNTSDQTVDIYWRRKALIEDLKADGSRIIGLNMSPENPANKVKTDFGGRVGEVLVDAWMKSYNGKNNLLTTLKPGEAYTVSEDVGPRGWGEGMYDLLLVDHDTQTLLSQKSSFKVETFVSSLDKPIDRFDREPVLLGDDANGKVTFHQRGLFDGASRRISIDYNANSRKSISFSFGNTFMSQYANPSAPFYNPTMFYNDVMKGGWDQFGNFGRGQTAQDNGEYGVDDVITMRITGKTAIAIQAAGWNLNEKSKPPVDMYDQFFVTQLDQNDPVQTEIKDPNYNAYFTNFKSLSHPGLIQKIYEIDPEKDGAAHTLRVMISPNGYGPFRVVLMPL